MWFSVYHDRGLIATWCLQARQFSIQPKTFRVLLRRRNPKGLDPGSLDLARLRFEPTNGVRWKQKVFRVHRLRLARDQFLPDTRRHAQFIKLQCGPLGYFRDVVQTQDTMSTTGSSAKKGKNAFIEEQHLLSALRMKGRVRGAGAQQAAIGAKTWYRSEVGSASSRSSVARSNFWRLMVRLWPVCATPSVPAPRAEQAVDIDARHAGQGEHDGLADRKACHLGRQRLVGGRVREGVKVGDVQFVDAAAAVGVGLVRHPPAVGQRRVHQGLDLGLRSAARGPASRRCRRERR